MPLLTLLDLLRAGFSEASTWAFAILGIGLVVFVHELGHFLVAKRCKVRVEIFSLGFGPRLFGVRRGDTDYRVSLVPIGGYVKMAGDNPGEVVSLDGGELSAKSIGQRFAIFAAGVVMNLFFAIVTLPVVLALGVQFHSTRVGDVLAGSPAWKADLRPGDEVLSVGGRRVYDFNDIIAEVALGDPTAIDFEVRRSNESTTHLRMRPEYDEKQGRYVVGVLPSYSPRFEVLRDGPSARAGLRSDDRIVSFDGKPVERVDEFGQLSIENRSERVKLGVLGADGVERVVEVTPDPAPTPNTMIGVRAFQNLVKAVRGRALERSGFVLPGDEIFALVRLDGSGGAETVDRVRDADEFAAALAKASGSDGHLALEVRRIDSIVYVPLPPDLEPRIAHDVALVQNPDRTFVRLVPGYPAAEAGLPDDCEIRQVGGVVVRAWADIKKHVEEQAAPDKGAGPHKPRSVQIVAIADGREVRVEVTPRVERPLSEFGLAAVPLMESRRFGIFDAARVGVLTASTMLKNVYLTLKKMFTGEVSAKNLSGILTIAYVSRSLAELGAPTLFFFLAVLSLNLAFLNLLPIPVLDGGHLFFLLIEKVKGSPVSERVMGLSQLIGVVLVLALLVYVTYHDLRRLF